MESPASVHICQLATLGQFTPLSERYQVPPKPYELNSLQQIIASQLRTKLYVSPHSWTADHLHHLNVVVICAEHDQRDPGSMPPPSQSWNAFIDKVTSLSDVTDLKLLQLRLYEVLASCVRAILQAEQLRQGCYLRGHFEVYVS